MIESEGPSVPTNATVTDDSEYCVDEHIVLDLSGCSQEYDFFFLETSKPFVYKSKKS